MNKKGLRFTAILLTGTVIFGGQSLTAAASGVSSLASAGIEAALKDCYTASADVSIKDYLAPTVKSEYENIAIAKVENSVYIRSAASEESEVLGKLYANGAGTVLGTEGEWVKIQSGSVTGYVKASYLATGEEAEALAPQVGRRTATIKTETLKVRSDASLEAEVTGLLPIGEEVNVSMEKDDWIGVAASDGVTGFVHSDYVDLKTEFDQAESTEEEAARIAAEEAAKKAQEEAKRAQEEAEKAAREAEEAARRKEASKTTKKSSSKSNTSTKSSSKKEESAPTSKSGQAVVNYAAQFVGNRYVYGGTSLTNGADCSGFVMSVYAKFGISLPHSSAAMRSVGRGVSYSDVQLGDIICYSGHVGIYAGNGQIVNALNSRAGITYTSATYKGIVAVRRVL